MCDLGDLGYRRAKPVHKAHMSQRHDEGVGIDERVIPFHTQPVVKRLYERNLCASFTLGQPDVPHGRKVELAQHDFAPLRESQCARNGAHPSRGTRHQCYFVGLGSNEACK